jgi:hypothetical protein
VSESIFDHKSSLKIKFPGTYFKAVEENFSVSELKVRVGLRIPSITSSSLTWIIKFEFCPNKELENPKSPSKTSSLIFILSYF